MDSVAADFISWLDEPAVMARVTYYFNSNVDLSPMIAKLSVGLSQYLTEMMTRFLSEFMTAFTTQLTLGLNQTMGQLSSSLSDAFSFDADSFGKAFQFNMSQEDFTQLIMSMMRRQLKTYEGNLTLLGYASHDKPSTISIYPRDFASKQVVIDILDGYNNKMKLTGHDDRVIVYTDYVGALMGSVTDIIDMITAVLVAFVAISLIVSSIMIGIVTYISVLERKKEIGILRSIGASKRDVGNVFNAETLIIGFTAGLIGIVLTALLCFPANWIVEAAIDVRNIAILPLVPSLVLIVISCVLSFVAGLIPSAAASRRDPVEALRSE
jgi:ABC-type antimicrobial peptide transport system permease subunit